MIWAKFRTKNYQMYCGPFGENWYKNAKLHRDAAPAIVHVYGYCEWRWEGLFIKWEDRRDVRP